MLHLKKMLWIMLLLSLAAMAQTPVSQMASRTRQATLQSSAVASGNGSTLNTSGMASAVLTVNCATCSGGTTVNFEGTQDGTNFAAVNAHQLGTNTINTTTATAGLTYWELPVANLSAIRARVSAYSAGTVTITSTATPMSRGSEVLITALASPENFTTGVTAAVIDTTSTSVIASAGTSLRNYVTSCMVMNSHATVGTFVKILDGTTIIDEGYAAAAGGGFVRQYLTPLRGTAATAINCQAVTTGANFICSCQGYKGL